MLPSEITEYIYQTVGLSINAVGQGMSILPTLYPYTRAQRLVYGRYLGNICEVGECPHILLKLLSKYLSHLLH